MSDQIQYLTEAKNKFQIHLQHSPMLYTFIGPRDLNAFELFYSIAQDQPALSSSMYEVLSNEVLIQSILRSNFSDTEILDLYISTNDNYSQLIYQGLLSDYIKKQQINFNY